MIPREEILLYKNDYPAWLKYAAPRWLELLLLEPGSFPRMWATAGPGMHNGIALAAIAKAEPLSKDEKLELWNKLGHELKVEIRKIKDQDKETNGKVTV